MKSVLGSTRRVWVKRHRTMLLTSVSNAVESLQERHEGMLSDISIIWQKFWLYDSSTTQTYISIWLCGITEIGLLFLLKCPLKYIFTIIVLVHTHTHSAHTKLTHTFILTLTNILIDSHSHTLTLFCYLTLTHSLCFLVVIFVLSLDCVMKLRGFVILEIF